MHRSTKEIIFVMNLKANDMTSFSVRTKGDLTGIVGHDQNGATLLELHLIPLGVMTPHSAAQSAKALSEVAERAVCLTQGRPAPRVTSSLGVIIPPDQKAGSIDAAMQSAGFAIAGSVDYPVEAYRMGARDGATAIILSPGYSVMIARDQISNLKEIVRRASIALARIGKTVAQVEQTTSEAIIILNK